MSSDEKQKYVAMVALLAGGISLTMDALEKGFTDEALLHLGYHHAQAMKFLEAEL